MHLANKWWVGLCGNGWFCIILRVISQQDYSPQTLKLTMTTANPCIQCGACCAYFRVSFYWGETDAHPQGRVPSEMTEPVNHQFVAMRGTNQATKRCVALDGEVGQVVGCQIYEQRSNPCREFDAGDARCNQARAHWGLPAL